MGLLENLFKKQNIEKQVHEYFKTFTAYSPVFTSFEGGIYEMELCRAAIHAIASSCSKLKPEISGTGNKQLERKLQYQPNPFQDTAGFLYRLATIYYVKNNAFIVPIYTDELADKIIGYYCIAPQRTEVKEYKGVVYLRFTFPNGQHAAIPYSEAGILTQFQYENDFFGEDNNALYPTMQLIHAQNQGIIEGVKNSATVRFLGRLANSLKPETIIEERKRFTEDNLRSDNNGGIILADSKYADIKQIDSKPFIINSSQMQQIKENVFNYFGVNENILQNKFTEDEWNAFYEGKIEPFAIRLSLVMTNMTFSNKELAFNNKIIFTANRLQYASNTTKLNIVTQLFDRGFLTHNQGLEVFNMSPVENGDKRWIRKEYAEVEKMEEEINAGKAE